MGERLGTCHILDTLVLERDLPPHGFRSGYFETVVQVQPYQE